MNDKMKFPYVKASRFFQKILKFLTFILLPLTIAILVITRFLVGTTRIIFDGNFMLKAYDKINDVTDETLSWFIERDWIPNTSNWGDSLDGLFTFDSPITRVFILIIMVLICYLITIVLRKHSGEIKPLADDIRSYKLKRSIIDSLDAKRKNKNDEDSKKVKKLEKEMRKQLRKVKVDIHTVLRKNLPTPIKYYYVTFNRHSNDSVHDKVFKKIEPLQSSLSSKVPKSNFGQMNIAPDKDAHYFEGHYSLDKAPEALVVKLRRKLNQANQSAPEESQYVFPLNLFEDRHEAIEEKSEEGLEYAKSRQVDIMRFFTSEGIPATLSKEPFVGNTSIMYELDMPERVKKFPNVEEVESKIEHSMKIKNVRVEMASGKIKVTIPSNVNKPIDTKSLIEEVF